MRAPPPATSFAATMLVTGGVLVALGLTIGTLARAVPTPVVVPPIAPPAMLALGIALMVVACARVASNKRPGIPWADLASTHPSTACGAAARLVRLEATQALERIDLVTFTDRREEVRACASAAATAIRRLTSR